jgi:hypothetical protein
MDILSGCPSGPREERGDEGKRNVDQFFRMKQVEEWDL